jgi:hypothetical protein
VHAHAALGVPSRDGRAAPSRLPAPGRPHGPAAHVLAPRARCAPPSPPRRPTLRVLSHDATLAGRARAVTRPARLPSVHAHARTTRAPRGRASRRAARRLRHRQAAASPLTPLGAAHRCPAHPTCHSGRRASRRCRAVLSPLCAANQAANRH